LLLQLNPNLDENTTESELLINGIELFRYKNETVADFCIKGDSLIVAVQTKGIREISITCSLLFRNRNASTHDLVDDELYTWYDCLHRFD